MPKSTVRSTRVRANQPTRQPKPQPTPTPDPQPDPEGYLSRAETAAFTRLNVQTIDAAIASGRLTVSRVGRRVLIRKPHVISWLNGLQK